MVRTPNERLTECTKQKQTKTNKKTKIKNEQNKNNWKQDQQLTINNTKQWHSTDINNSNLNQDKQFQLRHITYKINNLQ